MQRIREISQFTQEIEKGSSESFKQIADKPEFAKELDLALGNIDSNKQTQFVTLKSPSQ